MGFQLASTVNYLFIAREADVVCSNARDVVRDGGVCRMQIVMV